MRISRISQIAALTLAAASLTSRTASADMVACPVDINHLAHTLYADQESNVAVLDSADGIMTYKFYAGSLSAAPKNGMIGPHSYRNPVTQDDLDQFVRLARQSLKTGRCPTSQSAAITPKLD